VRRAHGPDQTVSGGGAHDQVDVVGHQAVGPDLHVAPPRLRGEQVAVDLLFAVLKEDRLAPVAPLGDVMRQSRGDDAGEAGHGAPHSMIGTKPEHISARAVEHAAGG
jgi:hypothetical protein